MVGDRLGRYVVLKHLASGGMADVVLARSNGIEGFERHVVLKRIRPELARDPRFVRMFLDEARVVASLHHQNIVQVHDIGEVDGEYFIAMEYVHGADVRKILSNAVRQDTHVPLGNAVAIISAAAAGLHYAHERRGSDRQPLNIVHRDVSPSNIVVGHDGCVKVVDFGIATGSMREETRSGSLKGKLSYMSPEQCKGSGVDRRSDVYGLGVVLYELATTTPMIRGESDYLMMEQIVHGRIPAPQLRRPGLPNELQDIIMRALATDRERRYATADDLRIALDRFASDAGLTDSAATLDEYMRQQFGQPPEPWLELDDQTAVAAYDVVPYPVEAPDTSWTESPSDDDDTRCTADPAPLLVLASDAASGVAAPASLPRAAITIVPSSVIPTDLSVGWESLPRAAGPSGSRVRKAAMAAVAIVAVMAIWLVTRSTSATVTPVAASAVSDVVPHGAVAIPPTAPPRAAELAAELAAPVIAVAVTASSARSEVAATASARRSEVAATALPARSEVAAAASPARSEVAATASSAQAEAAHAPESPAQRKPRAAVTTRTATKSGIDPAPPSARSDRLARLAAFGSTAISARGGEVGVADAGVGHVLAAPPLPALAVQQPPVAVATATAAEVDRLVSPPALDANRIGGDRQIVPDGLTMTAIGRSGSDTVISLLKVCVAADGRIHTVTQVRSSGFPAYDAKIQDTIRRDWRYRPYLVNGKAIAVCTAFKFMYSQK